MDEFLKAAANMGFPMVVAAYLLIRIESKLDNLSSSITQLATTILLQSHSSMCMHNKNLYFQISRKEVNSYGIFCSDDLC